MTIGCRNAILGLSGGGARRSRDASVAMGMGVFRLIGPVAIAVALVLPAQAQVGYDRPGGDYPSSSALRRSGAMRRPLRARFALPRLGLFLSRDRKRQRRMLAQSHVLPRIAASCCVSGVRGAGVIEPKGGPIEFAVDRIGGDYRHFEVPADPTGKTCQVACEEEESCRAWTYMRAGYGTASAACYLKNRITRPRRRPCCISGVVRSD